MRNIRLSKPVILPRGTIYRISLESHFQEVHTIEDLEELAVLLRETEAANRTCGKLVHIGAPDIIQLKSYQKLQNTVWKLFDRFPAAIPRS